MRCHFGRRERFELVPTVRGSLGGEFIGRPFSKVLSIEALIPGAELLSMVLRAGRDHSSNKQADDKSKSEARPPGLLAATCDSENADQRKLVIDGPVQILLEVRDQTSRFCC